MASGIPFGSLEGVLNGARTKFYTNFRETQRIRSYAFWQNMWKKAGKEGNARAIEWTMRPNSGSGTTASLNAYEDPTYVRSDVVLNGITRQSFLTTHLNCVLHEREVDNNKGVKDKLYDILDRKYSEAEEERAETFESLALNAPYDASDTSGKFNFVGLLGLFGRSMTAGGVFTAQPTPAFNGVYYRQGNGALSSTVYGINRANAGASRARTLVGTHSGTINQTTLETVRDANRDSRFDFLGELRGEKPAQSELVIFWSDQAQAQYETLLCNLGAPRTRDYFNSGDVAIKGVRTVAVPSLNSHFLAPIFGVNMSEFKFMTFKNWNRPVKDAPGYRTVAMPHENEFSSICRSPASAGYLIHGSFTTGT